MKSMTKMYYRWSETVREESPEPEPEPEPPKQPSPQRGANNRSRSPQQQQQPSHRRGGNNNAGRHRGSSNSGGAKSAFRKESIYGLGLLPEEKKVKTVFDEEDELDDDVAPGAFNHPADAFDMARKDLQSKQWQTEIDGLEALLRLVKYHRDFIDKEIPTVVADVTHECKNLRSQVTRAAMQTVTLMVRHLDVAVDVKGVKELIVVLLTKTGDTNQFIRQARNLRWTALPF